MPVFSQRGAPVPAYVRKEAARASLSDVGMSQGPNAVLSSFLHRASQSLIEGDAEASAQSAVDKATLAGTASGEAAARDLSAPTFTNDETLYGRAFDKAQLRAWQARMEVGVTEQGDKLAMAHAADPAAFVKGWDDMAEGLKSQLPPEISAEVGVVLDKRREHHLAGIRTNAFKEAAAEANANLLDGMSVAQTKAANAWRAGDAEGAGGFDDSFRRYLDARTDLTPQHKQAEWIKYTDHRRRDAVLGEYDRAKQKGGLDAASRFVSDFTKPGTHPDLDPDFVTRLGAEMGHDVHALVAERRVAVAELKADLRDAEFRVMKGYGSAELPQLAARARALGDPDTAGHIGDLVRIGDDAESMARLPLPEQQARLAALDAAARTGSDKNSVVRVEAAKRVLHNTMAELKRDPIGFAAATKQIPMPAIDFAKPETLAARGRAADQLAAYHHLPGAATVLSDAEAADLSGRLDAATAEQKSALLGNLYQGFGTRHLPSVLDAVKAKAPEFAHAGALTAQGAPDVARDVLFGAEIRHTVGKAGAPGGKQYLPPNDIVLAGAFQSHLPHQAVDGMSPDDINGLHAAVLSSYAAKSFKAGLASQQVVDAKLFSAAVTDVTGGIVDWNGKAMVAPVRGMKQSAFADLMGGLTDPDLAGARTAKGQPLTAADMRRYATFRMVDPGRYLVQVGDGFAAGDDGRPLVLDLKSIARRKGG